MSGWTTAAYLAVAAVGTGVAIDQGKAAQHQAKLNALEAQKANDLAIQQAKDAAATVERQTREQMAMAERQAAEATAAAQRAAVAAAQQQANMVNSSQQQKAATEAAKAIPQIKTTPEVEIRANVDTARRRRQAFSSSAAVRI